MHNNLRVLTYLQDHPGTPEAKLKKAWYASRTIA